MTRTNRIIYTCEPGYHTTGGMIDAGPGPITATRIPYTGQVHFKGPKIDYTVERVSSWVIEEVTI